MKRLTTNNDGSAYPAMILIICLAIASALVLFMGEVLEPFMNFMNSPDDSISSDLTAPRENSLNLFQIIWPKGVLLVVLLGCALATFMEYQKSRYQKEG